MKTVINDKNPFGYNRYGFLWEKLYERPAKGNHLDYGAYDGNVLKEMSGSEVIEKGIGVDLNSEIVEKSLDSCPENIQLECIESNCKIPYGDNYFDTVSILDVIEHVYEQQSVIEELHRVLKPNGLMVITVPKKHIFSFLDLGNWKFIFPKLHKIVYSLSHSSEEYEYRYVTCPNGLIGDIDIRKRWHQHFNEKELSSLLEKSGFHVIEFDGAGFFCRILHAVSLPLPDKIKKKFDRLMAADMRIFSSCHLFAVAKKIN
ncbi:MAG: SAM-dependent methyltransferase [Candidatus Electrothrix sp. AUS1_2]|nr:SAM-dependent methyltransferase [Candidatus Electrothrix sp. AUS1_2]